MITSSSYSFRNLFYPFNIWIQGRTIVISLQKTINIKTSKKHELIQNTEKTTLFAVQIEQRNRQLD